MDHAEYAMASGAYDSAPALREQSQVARELGRQASALSELHDALGTLEIRTMPIRLARPETKASQPEQPREPLVAIANEIADHRGAIEQATRRVLAMLSELEL